MLPNSNDTYINGYPFHVIDYGQYIYTYPTHTYPGSITNPYIDIPYTPTPKPVTHIHMDISLDTPNGPLHLSGSQAVVAWALMHLPEARGTRTTQGKGSSTQSQGKRKTQEEKAIIVAEALASGNMSQYAREKGLSYQTLVNWVAEAKTANNDGSKAEGTESGPGESASPKPKRGKGKKS